MSDDDLAYIPPPPSEYKPTRRAVTWYVLAGVVYGLALRGGLVWIKRELPPVMSMGFILGVPFVMGFISVYLAERDKRNKIREHHLQNGRGLLLADDFSFEYAGNGAR